METSGPRGLWVYGPPGVGKTYTVRHLFPDAFMKNQNKWFDGYKGEETIILDDLDTSFLGHYLKRWMDQYPVTGEVKGGLVALRHRRFIVTSNYTPEMLWVEDHQLAAAVRRRCTFWKISRARF